MSLNYIRTLFLVLTLSLFTSCGDKLGDDDLVDDGIFVYPDEIEHTLIMFFPWSTNLTSSFYTNISDMESAIEGGILEAERVFVCFEKSAGEAELFELYYDGEVCEQVLYKTYQNSFTTTEEIKTMFNDVVEISPSNRYSISIGAHGMGWLPVSYVSSREASAFTPHYEYGVGTPTATRYYGGGTSGYQTDISTLRDAIIESEIGYFDYILFDNCYMANIEIAYELRNAAGYLIASPTEIMVYGFPYDLVALHLLGDIDYAGVVEEFYNFYSTYSYPYATIGVINCSQTETMAAIMSEINAKYEFNTSNLTQIQRMDGYSPSIFFDMGSYVSYLCDDDELLARFEEQLELMVPPEHKAHTGFFPSTVGWGLTTYQITTYSGVTISDPSINSEVTSSKLETEWYQATH